jgi:HicA toxin of bacterial toxin-antitoxin,
MPPSVSLTQPLTKPCYSFSQAVAKPEAVLITVLWSVFSSAAILVTNDAGEKTRICLQAFNRWHEAKRKTCVVPYHKEVKRGTLKNILKQVGISEETFLKAARSLL